MSTEHSGKMEAGKELTEFVNGVALRVIPEGGEHQEEGQQDPRRTPKHWANHHRGLGVQKLQFVGLQART